MKKKIDIVFGQKNDFTRARTADLLRPNNPDIVKQTRYRLRHETDEKSDPSRDLNVKCVSSM